MDSAAQTLYVGEYEAEKRFKTRAFPNPSSEGILNLKCYAHFDDVVLVRVFDPMGSFVQSIKLEPAFNGENTFEWHYEVLRAGNYFYEVLINGQRESSGSIVIVK
jgi:hypothetical protein